MCQTQATCARASTSHRPLCCPRAGLTLCISVCWDLGPLSQQLSMSLMGFQRLVRWRPESHPTSSPWLLPSNHCCPLLPVGARPRQGKARVGHICPAGSIICRWPHSVSRLYSFVNFLIGLEAQTVHMFTLIWRWTRCLIYGRKGGHNLDCQSPVLIFVLRTQMPNNITFHIMEIQIYWVEFLFLYAFWWLKHLGTSQCTERKHY